jgi:hypothetical protein
MEKGDKNTKFFQAYAKGRKLSNTIWSMKNSQAQEVFTFEELARLGKIHFSSLFKADNWSSMENLVRSTGYFPGFVDEDTNKGLMEEVTKDELKEVLHGFQKEKTPGSDSWSLEFFLGFFI